MAAWVSIAYGNHESNPVYLGAKLFLNGELVENAIIPSGVTQIKYATFWNYDWLQSITIPEGVTTIEDNVFNSCSNLRNITIPASVVSIGNYAFYGCSNMTSISVAEDNASYRDIEGVLFTNDGSKLIAYPGGRQGAYTIPSHVAEIYQDAFFSCSGLTSITIPESVRIIRDCGFEGCTALTDVYYAGSSVDWAGVSKGSGNDPLTGATLHCARSVLTAASRTDLSDASVTDVEMTDGDSFLNGTSVTVSAAAKPGYSFLGWYPTDAAEFNEASRLSAALCYTFPITEDTSLAAVFRARGVATVTVAAVNGASYTVGESDEVKSGGPETVQLGTTLTLHAEEPGKVLQWQNESGKVLGTGGSLSIPVNGNMTVTLVYNTPEESHALLLFVGSSGQVLSYGQVSALGPISFPTYPSRFGYLFNGWVFDRTANAATDETIRERIGTEALICVRPSYARDNTTYTVTVAFDGVDRAAEAHGTLSVGSAFTAVAPEIDGYLFKCWKNASGAVLGYDERYLIQVTRDLTLTACYVPDSEPVTAQPVITATELTTTALGSTHKLSFVVTRSIPDGYRLVEHGVLYGVGLGGLTDGTFVFGSGGVFRYQSGDTSKNGVVRLNNAVSSDETVIYYRGYMLLTNESTGNEECFYTDIVSGSYNSINS